jgi:hypothetical protein
MAENFKSQGSFGLPHWKNSRAAQELYEPLYLNLFTVQIALPVGVGSSEENTNLLLENVQKITGLVSHTFPTTPVAQQYKWATRRFAAAKPEQTTMDVTLSFEVNLNKTPSAYVIKTLRKWCDLVYDPLTGRTGLKVDYVAPWMLITMYDRAANPFWQWKCLHVFPISQLPAVDFDYMGTEIFRIEGFTVAVDAWEESIV